MATDIELLAQRIELLEDAIVTLSVENDAMGSEIEDLRGRIDELEGTAVRRPIASGAPVANALYGWGV